MYSTKQLGDAMKDFIESIMDKYDVVLAHRDHFHKSFGKKLIEMYPKRAELPPDEELVTPEQAAQVRKSIDELAESKAIEPEPPRIDPVKKLKAEILMGLPDGINVIALNKTLAYMIEVNPDREPAEVLEIIAGDLESFEPMIRKFCKTEGIKSGLPGDEEDEPVAQTDNTEKPDNGTTDKPEYSDFRQKWINLKWDDFNSFLIRNADEFKANREEYDAAVKKYDRLKKNNGAENMCFPYLFGPHPDQSELPELSTENSVIEKNPVQSRFSRTEEASLMKQFQTSMPKMMKKTSDACGISPHSTDPDEISTFLDELQHQVHTWETKNFGKTYTEET
jgi:hypothetical protein